MIFNEILIPQDYFTETNVIRKRSVVGNFQSFFKTQSLYFFLRRHIFKRYIFLTKTIYYLISIFNFKHMMHNKHIKDITLTHIYMFKKQ